jgi:uncharacterized glyoxalase superfamily protein PhnB
MPAPEYARTLVGLTVNLVSSDPDFAALELETGDGQTARIQLHADHTWERMPAATELAALGPRGIGVELRLLGADPDAAEARASEHGVEPALGVDDWAHGWREVHLRDPDGYLWVVGRVREPG